MFRGYTDVRREHQFHPAGDAITVDRSDDWLVHRERMEHRDVAQAGIVQQCVIPLVFGRALAGRQRQHSGKIGAGGKGLVAGAGYDRHADRVVRSDPLPGLGQLDHQFGVDSVVNPRAIEREVGNSVTDLEQQRACLHETSRSTATSRRRTTGSRERCRVSRFRRAI